MASNKLERLLKLIAVLLDSTRPMAAEEIWENVEGYPDNLVAFRRAFERDKDELREMGVPLKVVRVPATEPPVDGYVIPADEYYLADPGLEPEELAALHLATMAVRFEGSANTEALWKLGGQVDVAPNGEADDSDSLDVDSIANVPVDPRLSVLFGAITSGSPVTFEYRGETRSVEPGRLDFQRGRWYLTGHDRDRDGERNFRLDRVDGDVRLSGEPGEIDRRPERPGRRIVTWEMGDGEPVPVEMRVDASHAGWARRQMHGDVTIVDHDDGSITATLPVRNEEAFRSFALDFLDRAEVIGPPDVRDRTVAWLEAIAGDEGRG